MPRAWDTLTDRAKAIWRDDGRVAAKAWLREVLLEEHVVGKAVAEAVAEEILRGERTTFERLVAKAPKPSSDLFLVRTLAKAADEEDFIVYGPCSVAIVDKEGDLITGKALRGALPHFLKRKTLSLAHMDIVVGAVLETYTAKDGKTYRTEVRPITKEDLAAFPTLSKAGAKVGTDAMFLVGAVYKDTEFCRELRKEILDGNIRAFSISGQATKEDTAVVCEDGMVCKIVNRVDELAGSAITLCAEPMNDGARDFLVLKENKNMTKDCGCGGKHKADTTSTSNAIVTSTVTSTPTNADNLTFTIQKYQVTADAKEVDVPIHYPAQPSGAEPAKGEPSEDGATKGVDVNATNYPAGSDRMDGARRTPVDTGKKPKGGYVQRAIGALDALEKRLYLKDAHARLDALLKAEWQWDPTPEGRPRASRVGFGGNKQYVYDEEATRLTQGGRGVGAQESSFADENMGEWDGASYAYDTATERAAAQAAGTDVPEPAYESGALVADVGDVYEEATLEGIADDLNTPEEITANVAGGYTDPYDSATSPADMDWDGATLEEIADDLNTMEPGEDDITSDDPSGPFFYGGKEIAADRQELRDWMDQNQYWPSVWFVSDHGNAHPITDLHDDEDYGPGDMPPLGSPENPGYDPDATQEAVDEISGLNNGPDDPEEWALWAQRQGFSQSDAQGIAEAKFGFMESDAAIAAFNRPSKDEMGGTALEPSDLSERDHRPRISDLPNVQPEPEKRKPGQLPGTGYADPDTGEFDNQMWERHTRELKDSLDQSKKPKPKKKPLDQSAQERGAARQAGDHEAADYGEAFDAYMDNPTPENKRRLDSARARQQATRKAEDEAEEVVPEDELVQKPTKKHAYRYQAMLDKLAKEGLGDEDAHKVANVAIGKHYSHGCPTCFRVTKLYDDPLLYAQVMRKAAMTGKIAWGALSAHDHRHLKREWPKLKAACERALALVAAE